MKITAGNLKGKKLFSVPGLKTRPTAGRIRESIFNILSHRIVDAIVLDLFAGTGALGIEALSRGASFAYFIDNRSEVISVIRKNIRSCDLKGITKISKWNIMLNLNCIKNFKPKFNLVFMDPPYGNDTIKPAILNLYKSSSLQQGACIVVEHSAYDKIPLCIQQSFNTFDQRKYGKTAVSFLTYNR